MMGALLYLQMALRAVIAFLAILLIARILEKEHVGELSLYEYLTGIAIGVIAGRIATTLQNPLPLLLALFVFAALTYLVRYFTLKSRAVRKLLAGEPAIVIQNGKIMERTMRRMHYSTDDLLMQLRTKGVFNISDVEFAVVEPNGRLSVLLKSQKMPVTREDMQIPSQYQGISSELIVDGEIIYQNLRQNNLDEAWLISELAKQGIKSPREVMLASLDTQGNLYVDKRQDDQKHDVQVQDDPGE
ncbi:MAG: hypothetical protein PWQ39_608 [Thermacetogenium sp.]|nr:hypothetical protein [Thermacetogenium sp.]